MNRTPWRYDAGRGFLFDSDGLPIAVYIIGDDSGMAMAAAPDMLEALENIREVIKDLPGVRVQANNIPADLAVSTAFEKIDKAIDKAKGSD